MGGVVPIDARLRRKLEELLNSAPPEAILSIMRWLARREAKQQREGER